MCSLTRLFTIGCCDTSFFLQGWEENPERFTFCNQNIHDCYFWDMGSVEDFVIRMEGIVRLSYLSLQDGAFRSVCCWEGYFASITGLTYPSVSPSQDMKKLV